MDEIWNKNLRKGLQVQADPTPSKYSPSILEPLNMATLVYMKQLWSWLYSRALLRIDSRCGHLKQLGVLLYSWPTDLLTDLCSGQLLLMCRAMLSHGQERKFQTRKGKGSLTTCISVVTPNRSEMKHYYGGATLQGGGDHSRPLYFNCLLAQSSVFW